ncbi:MAG: glycosyltransferase family 4 protein [Lachnospiraceae bacterium]|nr:glycosyltransferase family 4 protein [Lachnospiraceae bacterium]
MDSRITVLITASTFPRYDGDTEPRFILDLAEALQKYCDVTVLAPSAPEAKSEEMLNGVKVIRYRYFPIKRLETLCYPGAIVPRIKQKKSRALLIPFLFIALWWNVKKYEKQFDVVNAHWIIPQGIIQSFCKQKYVITGHGADVVSLNKGILKKIKARTLGKASAITVVSTRLKEFLERNYNVQNIEICPMGCKLGFFSPSNRKEKLSGVDGKRSVLFVGRLAEKKGVCYLIDAMEKVDAKLIIVGNGPLENELKEQAKRVNADIEFWGNKSHDELKTILPSADVYVAPSITAQNGDTEGLPVSIMEAMASGVPVVASDSGGISDMIIHGQNGLLTQEKDVDGIATAINMILNDTELASQLKNHALETIKEYDYDVIAQKYFAMYQKVLRKG